MKHSTGCMALFLPNRASSLRAQLKKAPSNNAGSIKRSDKCSKASVSNKHMNYSNCQELWLHDITSSSLLLLKSKHGYPMCRWAAAHNLLCFTVCVSVDVHRLPQRKSFHLKEKDELCKQLLSSSLQQMHGREMLDLWPGFAGSEMNVLQSPSYYGEYNGHWLLALHRARYLHTYVSRS